MLVVEDPASVAGSMRTMLESRRFAADVVADGEAGLDHLLRGCYDAAIVGVGLPRMDGFTLTRTARAKGLQTPVLMLMAHRAAHSTSEIPHHNTV